MDDPVEEIEELKEELSSLYYLVYRIRKAAGDPDGRPMQDELIEHISKLRKMAQDNYYENF